MSGSGRLALMTDPTPAVSRAVPRVNASSKPRPETAVLQAASTATPILAVASTEPNPATASTGSSAVSRLPPASARYEVSP